MTNLSKPRFNTIFIPQQCRASQQCQQCKSAASTGDHITRVIENQLFLGTPLDIQLNTYYVAIIKRTFMPFFRNVEQNIF